MLKKILAIITYDLSKLDPRYIRRVFLIIGLALYPVFLFLAVEYISHNHLSPVPELGSVRLLNYLIALSICGFFVGIFGRVYTGLLVTSLLLILTAVVNATKIKILHQPLFPWDVTMATDVLDISGLIWPEIFSLSVVITGSLFLGLALLSRRFLGGLRIKPALRFIVSLSALVFLACLANYRALSLEVVLDGLNIVNERWNQENNYNLNGFMLAFCLNFRGSLPPGPPPGYSRESIQEIVREIEAGNADRRRLASTTWARGPSNQDQSTRDKIGGSVSDLGAGENEARPIKPGPDKGGSPSSLKPHVILMLSESFWDPTLLPNVSIQPDPMPHFRALSQQHTSGRLLSPTHSGNTTNVEYELLTGLSMAYIPDGSLPLQQYLHKPTQSLATVFREAGYRAVAIQPCVRRFMNGEGIYGKLGFERYYSVEDFDHPQYCGHLVCDFEVSREIIKQTSAANQPMFIFALTWENHTPYYRDKYKNPEIKISSSFLSVQTTDRLTTYAQGIKDADDSLQLLIDHYQQSTQPVIIVFFGDHLPYFGPDFELFRQGGLIAPDKKRVEDLSFEDIKRLLGPPFIMWTNFSREKMTVPTISPIFLGHYLLEAAGIDHPYFGHFLGELLSQYSGFGTKLQITSGGELQRNDIAKFSGLFNQYRLLNYDLLFGRRYARFQASPPEFGR